MIKRFTFNNERYNLINTDQLEPNENIFTILIGKNGTGKSSFLRELIDTYVKKLYYNSTYNYHKFDEIISLSISPFDKFPIFKKNPENYMHYHYLGLRQLNSNNFSKYYLNKIMTTIFKSLSSNLNKRQEILNVLDYLGYKDNINITFKSISGSATEHFFHSYSYENYLGNLKTQYSNINPYSLNNDFFKEHSDFEWETLQEYYDNYLRMYRRFPNIEMISQEYNQNDYYEFYILLAAGLLSFDNIYLKEKSYNSRFDISNASSGEQSVILNILGIASKITHNSLICIDEPEICLHPEWQEKYIEILINTFKEYKNCHFIIATHSPQIISKLENQNCFILPMESRELKNAKDFINHSVDFQLANLFNAPGFKNEYLSRIALNIFTKVSRRKEFDEEDLKNYNLLYEQSKHLSKDDPVYDLYIAISELKEHYA